MDWIWKTLREVKGIIEVAGTESALIIFAFVALIIFFWFVVKAVRAIEKKDGELALKDAHIDSCEKKCDELRKRIDTLETELKSAAKQIKMLVDKLLPE